MSEESDVYKQQQCAAPSNLQHQLDHELSADIRQVTVRVLLTRLFISLTIGVVVGLDWLGLLHALHAGLQKVNQPR